MAKPGDAPGAAIKVFFYVTETNIGTPAYSFCSVFYQLFYNHLAGKRLYLHIGN